MYTTIKTLFASLGVVLMSIGCQVKNAPNDNVDQIDNRARVQIILGSTRQGRISDKIAGQLVQAAASRTDVVLEIVDLRDYSLPFLYDAVSPASRETITDPIIQKWSDTIARADAYVIVSPEYNSGYPGVLKNALDLLYKEWNGKPVGFVGYSGGPTGGTSSIAQLRTVAKAFKMTPVADDIYIPLSWKAFDDQGHFQDGDIAHRFNSMLDELIIARAAA